MNVAHGYLFHHFHDDTHPAGQGSLSADEFRNLLEYVGVQNILPSAEWAQKALSGSLSDTDRCITFDDNLRCQFDIALPVLSDMGLTAFWFVYTSPLNGVMEKLELYRYFRSSAFPDVSNFYAAFFDCLSGSGLSEKIDSRIRDFDAASYLSEKPFYSDEDRKFRYIRNHVLSEAEYDWAMEEMMARAGILGDDIAGKLWMDADCLRILAEKGHVIGLHSHSHRPNIATADYQAQLTEYSDNYSVLDDILPEPPTTVSYPFGSYNEDTLSIMRSLGITLGFRADMAGPRGNSMELPRENHATTLMRMSS